MVRRARIVRKVQYPETTITRGKTTKNVYQLVTVLLALGPSPELLREAVQRYLDLRAEAAAQTRTKKWLQKQDFTTIPMAE